MEINVYCEESCHLEHDHQAVMVLGAIWCIKDQVSQISNDIRDIKERHGIPRWQEFKWTKVSPSKQGFYLELIDYFFNTGGLNFRGYVASKAGLNHATIPNQTHDTWYYKIYFRMLEQIFTRNNTYDIYLDIKDTRGGRKTRNLQQVLCKSQLDFSGDIIRRIQIVHSHEIELMQLADILIGALSFLHRGESDKDNPNEAKKAVIQRIKDRSGFTLTKRTYQRETKFNLFFWTPGNIG